MMNCAHPNSHVPSQIDATTRTPADLDRNRREKPERTFRGVDRGGAMRIKARDEPFARGFALSTRTGPQYARNLQFQVTET